MTRRERRTWRRRAHEGDPVAGAYALLTEVGHDPEQLLEDWGLVGPAQPAPKMNTAAADQLMEEKT